MGIKNPCIAVCTFDATTGLCRGCWRTVAERSQWSFMDDGEKLQTMTLVMLRKEKHPGIANNNITNLDGTTFRVKKQDDANVDGSASQWEDWLQSGIEEARRKGHLPTPYRQFDD